MTTLLFILSIQILSAISTELDDLYSAAVEVINKSANYTFPENNDEYFQPETLLKDPVDFGTYDFIIVGGGTAGGVLANRLTEKRFSVLLVEAGKKEPLISSVLGLGPYLLYSDWNWGYKTVPQQYACTASEDRTCFYPRGKSLGGSSILNGGMYARGNPNDYDEWEKLGNVGWSYEDCLPYFKKSEKAEFTSNIDEEYHGFDGTQSVNVIKDAPNLTTVFLDAFKELGLEELDYNGRNQYGVSRLQFYLDNNIRSSTAHSFIKPAEKRTNLKITTESLVTKVLMRNNTAIGIEFVRNGTKYFANATKEVIVSAGTINSPQVLLLSGIGPAEELQKHGIEVVADLPVGRYLNDHQIFIMPFRTNLVMYNNTLMENLKLWEQGERPLVVGLGAHLISFWNSTLAERTSPDTVIYVFQSSDTFASQFQFTEEFIQAYETINPLTDVYVLIGLLHAKSFGTITLQSSDPRDFPLIDPNYFSDPSDLETMYEAIQTVMRLNNTDTQKKWRMNYLPIANPRCDPVYEKLTKEWWYCFLQATTTTLFHPMGTTRMGVNPNNSVVNPDLKVHGIRNLRVVDAGVIPSYVSGHTNAPVVMIAEKIADVIKAEYNDEF